MSRIHFRGMALLPLLVLMGTVSAAAAPVSLNVGLTLAPPAGVEVTYQIVPEYDEQTPVLIGWHGDQAEYFLTATALPAEWRDADAYLARFITEVNRASEDHSLKVINRGRYHTASGLHGSYHEFTVRLERDAPLQHQVVHHLVGADGAYVLIATALTNQSPDQLRAATVAVLETAVQTDAPAPEPNQEAILVGNWTSTATGENGQHIVARAELKPDLSFVSTVTFDGQLVLDATGYWSLRGSLLVWHYLDSRPRLPPQMSLDIDEVISLHGDELVIKSSRSGAQRTFVRE